MRILVVLIALAILISEMAMPAVAAGLPSARSEFQILPKSGEKIPLGPNHYFTFAFAKQPKLGTAIMRVEIFTRDGVPDHSFIVKGDADMPSMRGAHRAGDQNFSLSAKGVYLLPVRLVMPGDWEVSFTFIKDQKTLLRGVYLFDL